MAVLRKREEGSERKVVSFGAMMFGLNIECPEIGIQHAIHKKMTMSFVRVKCSRPVRKEV